MALTNAERQRKYREKRKQQNEEEFLEKERMRKRNSYVPSDQLSASERRKRNQAKEITNRKSRERKRGFEKEQVFKLKIKFPEKAKGSKARMKNSLAKKQEEIERLYGEMTKYKRKYSALMRKNQRKRQSFSDSPRSRARRDIDAVLRNKTRAEKLRKKLVLYYALADEIKESSTAYKFKSKPKASIHAAVSGKILKKYRLFHAAAKETGLNRNRLAELTNKVMKETKRIRKLKEEGHNKAAVLEFLERSDNSTTMPNKKDVKVNKEGDKATPKRILNDYIDNMFEKFCLENPTIKMSRATFFRCRPEHILPVSFTTKRSCLCIKHQNMALMTNKGMKLNLGKSDGALDKFYKTYTNADLTVILDKIETPVVKFSQWKRVDTADGKKKISLVPVEMPNADFKNEVLKCADTFRQHTEMVKNQYDEIRRLKENLPDDHAVVQLDFAENYTCTSYDEVKSAYWNKSMVTIHPIVVYYKNAEGAFVHQSFAMISDELSHNVAAVLAFLKELLPILHLLIPNIAFVHYVSDSPTSQYRNKYIFSIVAEHESLFNVPASWHYFEAGHGKGPCDGVGAVAKRMADNAVKRDKCVIQDAKGFFACASSLNSAIRYIWVGTESIAESNGDIKSKCNLKPIKGTLAIHAVFGNTTTITARDKSCFCNGCFVNGKFSPESACSGWKSYELKYTKPRSEKL